MKEEKEIKIELVENKFSYDEIVSILEEIFKVNFTSKEHEIDSYYDNDINLYFKNNHALRIRNSLDKGFSIAYKALYYLPDRKQNPWFILEKESKFPLSEEFIIELSKIAVINGLKEKSYFSENEFSKELSKIGFSKKIVIDKIRKKAIISNKIEIVVDYIQNLGIFIELELLGEEKELKIIDILQKIPFKYVEFRFGYTNLYAQRILKLHIPDFNKLYKETPTWNYLEGQKNIVDTIIKNGKK